MSTKLTAEIIKTISDGSHGDPFSVLGLHSIKVGGSNKLVLRAFRPEAKQVFVNIGTSKPVELKRISQEGLFEHVFPKRKNTFEYTLTIEPYEGDVFTINDAYVYGSLISEFDLQLWGEGNHHQAYHFMGAHPKEVDSVKG